MTKSVCLRFLLDSCRQRHKHRQVTDLQKDIFKRFK